METNTRIRVSLLILMILLLITIFGCEKEPEFVIRPDIEGKEIYVSNRYLFYIINNNGDKEEIRITRDGTPAILNSVKVNEKGVRAFVVYVFEEENFSQVLITQNIMNPVRLVYYVLFISDEMKIKHVRFPFRVDDVEWVNDNQLKVYTSNPYEKDKDDVEYINNPFK